MKILLDVPFKDFRGNPIKDEVDTEGFTLRSVLIRSALFVDATGKNPEGKEKFAAFQLASKINAVPQGGAANFTTEELNLLKTNSGKMWMPWVVGLTWTHLDAHENSDEPAAGDAPQPEAPKTN